MHWWLRWNLYQTGRWHSHLHHSYTQRHLLQSCSQGHGVWRQRRNRDTGLDRGNLPICTGNPEEGTSKSSRKPFLFNNVSHDCVVTTGIECRWGQNFAPVHNGPGTQHFSCAIGTSSFLGVKCGQGVLLTTDPFCCRVTEEYSCISNYPLGQTDLETGLLYFNNSN